MEIIILEHMSQVASDIIGMGFEPDRLAVTPEIIERFARATNDHNPAYLGAAAIAPPLFGIVPAMLLLRRALIDERLSLPIARTVHGEQDMTFVAPIRAGDALVITGEVVATGERSTGSTIDIDVTTMTEAGDDRLRQTLTVFIRDPSKPKPPWRPAPDHGTPVAEASMRVDPDQTYRYAEASFTQGILPHEDPEFARALGYRTMFLQGQCTMAFAAKAIVDELAGGDPTRLRRMKTRFARVVYPEDVVTTRVWPAEGAYVFEATNQDGESVLVDGLAEIEE